ncbi:hypothetical protein CI109_106216 [Kwoniella shandongensis]|uniref:Uncharacterized protein n=1 Tax=Kwoniella shandongensis TaxID=1734106 RepID=A0A5M6BYB5_9TREE|nr:uncharacterized protein CI109_003820 [Kwoniella shandongensis]KAA5527848.1 hypothetical protein CI109_003820 [Kwoniella shandongensis]
MLASPPLPQSPSSPFRRYSYSAASTSTIAGCESHTAIASSSTSSSTSASPSQSQSSRSFFSAMFAPAQSSPSASSSRASTPSMGMGSPSFVGGTTPMLSPCASTHSRESSGETMNLGMAPSTPTTPTHRRSRSRQFWASLGDRMSHGKQPVREEMEDQPMDIDSPADDSISLTYPPSLPTCSLSASYQCSETSTLIPPSFYPGQSIPVVLTFELDRFSSLPHYLNPALTMSLVGTLHLPGHAPRTIICVSVSLAEGLALWARDAEQTYIRNPPRASDCHIDPSQGLPGGTYSLPLTVQVPSTPRLPPSFTVRSSSFAVTYALTVTLTCDDPSHPGGSGGRVVLAETAKPFEMMPETLPTRAPRYMAQSFWVKTDVPSLLPITATATSTIPAPLVRRQNTRWSVHPHIPTTAFSPTSIIPFTLVLSPPSALESETNIDNALVQPVRPRFQILVRLALVRREFSSISTHQTVDAVGNGLVVEEEIVSRWGWVETSSTGEKIKLRDIALPLMPPHARTWRHGMSTMLNVGPASNSLNTTNEESISVSSTFHLNVTLAFLSLPSIDSPTMTQYLTKECFPSSSDDVEDLIPRQAREFTKPSSSDSPNHFDLARFKANFPGTIKTLPIPIVVGSVSEPRGAMHNVRWSDLQLDRNASGTEVGRMISGESTTCENGWIIPPPSYKEALKVAPYEYE